MRCSAPARPRSRARFEERGLFAVAPTTILGMATRYSLGERGAINLIGMYQREQSAFNRPPLGFEASANLIGGVNTELHFKPSVGHQLPQQAHDEARGRAVRCFDVNAEFAFTKPDPNRRGRPYLEEFEGRPGCRCPCGRPVGVRQPAAAGRLGWRTSVRRRLQSRGRGGPHVAESGSAAPTATRRTPAQDIDTLIRLAGRGEQPETVLYLTLHADTAGGMVQQNNSSRWRSAATRLRARAGARWSPRSAPPGSTSRNDEYLEFWLFQPAGDPAERGRRPAGVRPGHGQRGRVAHRARQRSRSTARDTVYTGRQYVGLGRLDTERSDIGIFDAEIDDNGILGDRPDRSWQADRRDRWRELPLCSATLSKAVPIFPVGRPQRPLHQRQRRARHRGPERRQRARPTGSNENVFRYVVSLAAGHSTSCETA